MPTRRCWVPNCKNSKLKEAENARMYAFPRDVTRCRQWLKAIGDADLAKLGIQHLANFRYICKDHFLPSKITPLGRTANDAVPVIFSDVRPPLSDECLREFDEKSKMVQRPVSETNEITKKIVECHSAKPKNTVSSASYGPQIAVCGGASSSLGDHSWRFILPHASKVPSSVKVLCKPEDVDALRTILRSSGSQNSECDDVSSGAGEARWRFIVPRITKVESLAKTVGPTDEKIASDDSLLQKENEPTKRVESLANTVGPTDEKTVNGDSLLQKENEPTKSVMTLAKAVEPTVEKTVDDSLLQKENEPTKNASASVMSISPVKSTTQMSLLRVEKRIVYAAPQQQVFRPLSSMGRLRSLQWRPIRPRISQEGSVATAADSTPQETCNILLPEETLKVTADEVVQQAGSDAVSIGHKLTEQKTIVIPHSQDATVQTKHLIPDETCNAGSSPKRQENSLSSTQQTVCETVNSSVHEPQRTKRKSVLVPRCHDETSLTSFSPLTSANYSPPKKILKVDLQHKVEGTSANNACTPAKVIHTKSTKSSNVDKIEEVTLIDDETPVSSPEEIICLDSDHEDSNSCNHDILSSGKLNLEESDVLLHGHEEKKMTAVDKHQNQCSNLLVKDILSEQTLHECEDQVETLTDSCGRSREEDTNQKKETVMQKRNNLQSEVRGTSQRKEIVKQDKIDSQPEVKDMRQKKETMIQRKKNMQSSTFTRWRTDNLARKEKLRQRRERNKIQFSTETVQKTVNDAVEGKWEMMENAINEKQRQDKTAMEKQWNQLEDRVSQIIESKVENKLSQVIEDQLEKRINQILERRGNKELHCTIEKRIGKILEEKMEKIEQRITEVIDKKMEVIFQSLKSVIECRTVPDTTKWET